MTRQVNEHAMKFLKSATMLISWPCVYFSMLFYIGRPLSSHYFFFFFLHSSVYILYIFLLLTSKVNKIQAESNKNYNIAMYYNFKIHSLVSCFMFRVSCMDGSYRAQAERLCVRPAHIVVAFTFDKIIKKRRKKI